MISLQDNEFTHGLESKAGSKALAHLFGCLFVVFSARGPSLGSFVGMLNVEHRPNKPITYALQKEINKKTLKYKGNKPSHKIFHLS